MKIIRKTIRRDSVDPRVTVDLELERHDEAYNKATQVYLIDNGQRVNIGTITQVYASAERRSPGSRYVNYRGPLKARWAPEDQSWNWHDSQAEAIRQLLNDYERTLR